jgi:hypothetical protein
MPSVAATYGDGKFLKLTSVKANGPIEATIKDVTQVQMQRGPALALGFHGMDKRLTLNKSSAVALGAAFGDEAQSWVGRDVVLEVGLVKFGAAMVEAVLVRPGSGKGRSKAAPAASAKGSLLKQGTSVLEVEGLVQRVQEANANGKTVWWITLSTGDKAYTYEAGLAQMAKSQAGRVEPMLFELERRGQHFKLWEIRDRAEVKDDEPGGYEPEEDVPAE